MVCPATTVTWKVYTGVGPGITVGKNTLGGALAARGTKSNQALPRLRRVALSPNGTPLVRAGEISTE